MCYLAWQLVVRLYMLIVANVNHNQPVGVARVNEGKMSALCFSFTEHSVVVTTTTTTSTTTSTTTRVKPLPMPFNSATCN